MNARTGSVLRKVAAGLGIFGAVVLVVDIAATLVTGRTLRREMAETFAMLGVESHEEFVAKFKADMCSQKVENDRNAVASYVAAAAVLDTAPEMVDQALADISSPQVEATEEQKDAARKYLEEHPEVLRLAADGANKPSVYFERDWSAGWDMQLRELAGMRQLTRAVCTAAILHHEDGKEESAQGLLGIGMRISSSLDEDPLLISALVRMATLAMCTHTLERVISEEEVHPAPAHAILAGLDAEGVRDGMTKALIGEMYFGLHAFQNFSGELDPSMTPGIYERGMAAPVRNVDMAAYARYMRGMIEASREPWVQTKTDEEVLAGIPKTAVLTKLLVPTLSRVILQRDRYIAHSDCAAAAVRLKQYKQEHGEYPDELPAEIAVDDPFSGGPLLYKRDGAGFVVYSVGENLTDDGGVWAEGDSTDERFSKDIAFRCRN